MGRSFERVYEGSGQRPLSLWRGRKNHRGGTSLQVRRAPWSGTVVKDALSVSNALGWLHFCYESGTVSGQVDGCVVA